MPRRKEFDVEITLDRAADVFWSKGYEGASIQDLLDQMELNRGSLYDTFGGKHELYLSVLERYSEKYQKIFRVLEGTGSGKKAIRTVFLNSLDPANPPPGKSGCLVTNAMVEMAPHCQQTAARLQRIMRRLEKAFETALHRAQDQGEVSPNRDIRALAHFLTVAFHGIRAVARLMPGNTMIRNFVEVALSSVE